MKNYQVTPDGFYGKFGGTYVPESLRPCVEALQKSYLEIMNDPTFKSDYYQWLVGNIQDPYSISAGLDYPGIGPMHANLADTKRATIVAVNDDEAIAAALELVRLDGIIPALESSHALGALPKLKFQPQDVVVLTLSGRGDKDIEVYLGSK